MKGDDVKRLMSIFCMIVIVISHASELPENKKPRVLLLHFPTKYWGGVENHTLNRYQKLLEHGYDAHFLVVKQSPMEQRLVQLKLPFHVYSSVWPSVYELEEDIYQTCAKYNINIVLCNTKDNLIASLLVARKLPIKIVYFKHMPNSDNYPLRKDLIRGIAGVVGVSSQIAEQIRSVNETDRLGIGLIEYIPPFISEDKFLVFKPSNQARDEFFLQEFNLKLKPYPLICTIGNMYKNLKHKNYSLLFQAVEKLVFEKHKPVEVVLAGDGSRRKFLEKLVEEKNLQDYVHFLGFTQKTSELLFYADMHVLPSYEEAFGQVHIEAGLMKKPALGATGTGADDAIVHEKTGLIFKNDDCDDLVASIEKIIDNPDFGRQLGQQAYTFVRENFSNEATYEKLDKFLVAVAGKERKTRLVTNLANYYEKA